MGGLIVRAYLLDARIPPGKLAFLFFLGTPTAGANVAEIALHLTANPQLDNMRPLGPDTYVKNLREDWLRASDDPALDYPRKVSSYCAYEALPTYGFHDRAGGQRHLPLQPRHDGDPGRPSRHRETEGSRRRDLRRPARGLQEPARPGGAGGAHGRRGGAPGDPRRAERRSASPTSRPRRSRCGRRSRRPRRSPRPADEAKDGGADGLGRPRAGRDGVRGASRGRRGGQPELVVRGRRAVRRPDRRRRLSPPGRVPRGRPRAGRGELRHLAPAELSAGRARVGPARHAPDPARRRGAPARRAPSNPFRRASRPTRRRSSCRRRPGLRSITSPGRRFSPGRRRPERGASYSERSAFIGSMRAARRAGTQLAVRAIERSRSATPRYVAGSDAPTP